VVNPGLLRVVAGLAGVGRVGVREPQRPHRDATRRSGPRRAPAPARCG
jgi:hypothetical protein